MPPALFPRSIQVARLLKGLKRLGWASTVVTPATAALSDRDPIDAGLLDFYGGDYSVAPVDLSRVDPQDGPMFARLAERLRGEDRLSNDQLWVKRAADVTVSTLRRERAEVLVTFAQPWRDHLVGLELLRRGSRMAWVAHFSDPWVDSLYSADRSPTEIDAERRFEAHVVERADRIVFTNHHALELVMAKYPRSWRAKARAVFHTVDEDLVSVADRHKTVRPAGGPMHLAHIGNLFVGRRTAGALFDAIATLDARHPLAGRLHVELIGEGSGLREAEEQTFVLRLEELVSFRTRVSHIESLSAMLASDVLLLIDAPAATNVFLPSKLVDYLMVRRPVLALTPAAGATADVMRRFGYPVIDPTDVQAIAAELEQLMRRHQGGTLAVSDVNYAEQFGSEAISGAFSAILDEAIAEHR